MQILLVFPVCRIGQGESCKSLFDKDQQCNSKRRLKRLCFGLERLKLNLEIVRQRTLSGIIVLGFFSFFVIFVCVICIVPTEHYLWA
jgi:hypothetical protein